MNVQRRSCSIAVSARRRERVLAGIAFVMLVFAWDATLRLDERVAPPRVRMSHAVEREVDAVDEDSLAVNGASLRDARARRL